MALPEAGEFKVAQFKVFTHHEVIGDAGRAPISANAICYLLASHANVWRVLHIILTGTCTPPIKPVISPSLGTWDSAHSVSAESCTA
ncbi:hypothetical protein DICSQDRAFT_154998 [Dichomitus squalens LYAD-421 SS1]|uniref:Uncharacterized protein n=1 Tax=Dichomitus squalens (strain LYAD-421) TaxID=732165 RepID=R7T0S3_DICSQ|nr:uncharacterized protein DICSQDRAFT_154998 [Dichomitus squalens LYAD-421 SS1]EJF61828.1 hypothetical protein DICSQDRAFT_154998 [Dichomitus squalens LYAD-421 SS1]